MKQMMSYMMALILVVAVGCDRYRTITIRAVHVDGAPAADARVEPHYLYGYRLFSPHPDPALGTGKTDAHGHFTGQYDTSSNPTITVEQHPDWTSFYPFSDEYRDKLREENPVITVVLDRRTLISTPDAMID